MVTLKCIKPIKDSSVNRNLQLNEVFTVTPERVLEKETALEGKFKNYFVVQRVAKTQTKTTTKKSAKDKK